MTQEIRPVGQVLAAIDALDLGCIKLKLMDRDEGYGWSREFADQMELAYRRFLTLMAKYPHETIAPSKDVDRFWHAHILDTLKYAEDCQGVFGYFVHHFPYFGMRGEGDAKNLAAAAERTRALYEREFGARVGENAAFCGATVEAAFCGAAGAEAAFCGAAHAFCGAATAFCGAAGVKHDTLNVNVRPRLAAAA